MSFLILMLLAGCFIGYYFTTRALVVLTLLVVAFNIYVWVDGTSGGHIEGLVALYYLALSVYSTWFLAAMWLVGAYVRRESLRPVLQKVFSKVLR